MIDAVAFDPRNPPNTRRVGPVEWGTRPFWHWRLWLPSGIKLMRTPTGVLLYRTRSETSLRALPFTHRPSIWLRKELANGRDG